jgi:tetratricopeptide (TPR) repeat protein
VFHFHGHWDSPESVVLDPRSYERNLLDDSAQAVLQALGTVSSFLYIGCGEGLSDPHFEQFRKWLKTCFGGAGFFHYRLCLEREAAELEKQHAQEGMRILPYGADYGDLAPFLRSLAPGASAPSKPEPLPAPSLLPGRPICFGRENEVEILVAAFCAEPAEPAVVVGGAGMGKSTITLEAMHDPRVRKRFGARRFFVRCDGAKGREGLAEEIARTLGLKPQGNVALESQVATWLQWAPTLLILDNAETPWEVPEETAGVEELLSSLANVSDLALAVSMRGEQWPDGVRWGAVRVGPLSADSAREAFFQVAGKDFSAEPELLDRLLRELDYWALPINLLAHQAQSEPNLANLAKRWKDERIKVLERAGGKSKLTSLTASLEMSYTSPRLSERARRLLGLLGYLPDGISPEDLPALMPDGSQAAALLRQAGLTVRDVRIRVLAPIREWLIETHPPEPADFQRAVDQYVALASLGNQVGRKDGALASARLLAELRNLEAMVTTRLRQPDPGPGIQAACDLSQFFWLTGWGSPQLLHAARTAAEEAGDPWGEADCLRRLGELAFYRSQNEAAREMFDQARTLYQQLGSQLGEANCFWRLGELAFRRSQNETAREMFDQARTLYQQLGDPLGEANCLRSLGDLAIRRSQNEPAKEMWDQARTLYQQVGDPLGEARCLWSLGDLAFRRSQNEPAKEMWDQARTLYQQVGDPQGEANCLWSLGDLSFRRSQNEEAREMFDQARTLYQQVGDQLGEANCFLSLGEVAQRTSAGDPRLLYEGALALYQQAQDPYSIARAHHSLARISEGTRHVQTAREIWEGQDLPELVAMLDREFGAPAAQPAAKPKRRRKT